MLKISSYFTIFLLLPFSLVLAQADFQDDSEIKTGAPKDSTVFKELKISAISFSEIETGLAASELFLGRGIWKGKDVIWTRSVYGGIDQGFQIQSAGNVELDIQLFQSDVKLFADQDIVFPLEVKFTKGANVIEYRWMLNSLSVSQGAKASGSAPGFDLSEGNTLPDVLVENLAGEELELSQYRGKILVINWWSTTCGPCIKEMPELNRLEEKFNGHDIVFLAIAWDKIDTLSRFLRKKEFKYDQTWFRSKDTFALFGNAFPVHMVVDQSGDIAMFQEGYHPAVADQIGLVIRELREGS